MITSTFGMWKLSAGLNHAADVKCICMTAVRRVQPQHSGGKHPDVWVEAFINYQQIDQ
jgi:hypothetical protein